MTDYHVHKDYTSGWLLVFLFFSQGDDRIKNEFLEKMYYANIPLTTVFKNQSGYREIQQNV